MKLSDQTIDHWIAKAQAVLQSAFPEGSRAILHATRIAANVEPRLKPIAFMHDVVEDTSITLDDIRAMGFPSYILDAIDLLTHWEGMSNVQYWKRIKPNPDALAVKLADINDNLSDKPSDYAKQKYAKALAFFNAP